MCRHIFPALNMKSAGYYNRSEGNVFLATPYAGLGTPVDIVPVVMTGAGGVSATSSDMASFILGLIDYYRAGNYEMFKEQQNTNSDYVTYALGIIPHKLDNGTVIFEHNGTLTGWNAQIALEPVSGDGFVILCNSDKGFYLTNEMMLIWSKDAIGYEAEEKPVMHIIRAVIDVVWIAVAVTAAFLLYTFGLDIIGRQRSLVKGRKQVIKLVAAILIGLLLLTGWYGTMYTDYLFKWLYDFPDYCPFTFLTRNVDWIGYALIVFVTAIIARKVYPKHKNNPL